ncbi:MAG: hypothetical protein JAY74_26755 [Candidatus Thiodiazotropha taylori]|nr:hypothetical protein [Candidatus Thiodiazotropha taylori]
MRKMVPGNLMQNRLQRLESSQELLETYNENPENFHVRLVKGEMKHEFTTGAQVLQKESMQWKQPGSSLPKKFRTQSIC